MPRRWTARGLRARPHWLYLVANVPLVALIFRFLPYHTFLWGSMGLGATAAVVVGTFRNRPRHKWPWYLVAGGLGTFISGDITYDVLTKYMHENNPFPSLADVFYLATYLFLAAGLLGLVRARRQEPDLGALLDALIVASGAGLLSWIYLIQPYVHAHDMSLVVKAVSIAYPMGDILLLWMLARLLAAGAPRNNALRFLSVGAIGLLGADCIYGWIQLHGNWKVGGPTDLGWVAFYLLWGTAALHPSMRELTEKQPPRSRHLGDATLVALGAATLVGPLLLVKRVAFDGQAKDAGTIAGVSAFLFVLVMCRMTGLARSQAVFARRERGLREFGERLVAATERDEVLTAAVAAITVMVGSSARACLLTTVEGSSERVIVSQPTGFEGLEVVVNDNAESTRAKVSLEGLPPHLRLGKRWSFVPLVERATPRHRILISHDDPLPLDVAAILDSVATQLVIAVERVELASDLHQRRAEQRFRSLIENASDVIVVARPGQAWRSETPSLAAVLGYAANDGEPLDISGLIHDDDVSQALALVEAMLSGARSGPIRSEWRLRHADGRWLQMEVIANDLSHAPDVGGVVLTIRDVSERKLLEEELRHQAFHDGLTDLANRVLFNDRVEQALSRALRQGTMVAALLLDLDDFKLVNDTLGHSAGDDLLVQIGRRLRGCIRKGDTAARLGGDEFAICAEFVPTDKDDPSGLASRILEAFTFPFMVEGTELEARMSIGVAIAGDHTRSVDMLRDADLALYAAKNAGKATFRLFEPKLHQAVVARLEWRAALEKAIKGGELRLYYQPIVRLADETIVGLEGLVRWQHPVKGLVAPMEFIPLAEQTGLIIPLGAWVLGQACTDLARWQETWRVAYGTSPNVSVNVSPRQIHSGQFLKLVDQVLAEHSVDPTSLTLEITESCLAEDSDEVASCLRGLRDRGIALALDDFGTGYSSLSYLRRFPIQTLKIDRSFITAMDTPDGLTLVETIVSMARNLGLSVVAEGIEDAAQAAKLNMLGCDTGQGFLFWRPMPADGIDQLLEGKTEKVGEAAARQARALLATSH